MTRFLVVLFGHAELFDRAGSTRMAGRWFLLVAVSLAGLARPAQAEYSFCAMGVLSPSEFGRAEWNPDVSVGSERDTLRSIALFLNTGTRVPPKGRVRCISEIVRSDEPKPRKEVPIWSLSDFAIEALVWNGRYDNGEAILEYGVRRRKGFGRFHAVSTRERPRPRDRAADRPGLAG